MKKLALVFALILGSISVASAASLNGVEWTDVAPDGIKHFTTVPTDNSPVLHRQAPAKDGAEQRAFDRATDIGGL
jgi:hypothetical protein